ncbi:hypothetical protein LYSHEL_28060 [Lysobacter helvus]|uniref:Uncharacterized protein n=2 Tax=Lysobacteraceae TaxID=32033 RepID=A0ABN6FXX2_9GAMM|nr:MULTISPECIES: hypothetical protein [Lysobacter]BCT93779.1 hypothetical protein LYSCAS_28030 [Lysobacter caseinilyticus]BCT96935.1 hypothetical protein LYSHEL_28060 [Lysobacter helvus]
MDIHRADKAYRNRSLALLALVAALCGVLLWQLNTWLAHMGAVLHSSDPGSTYTWLRRLFAALGLGLALPAGALGIAMRRFALASRLEGRFPPRDWKTWRDVRVLRDRDAFAWARRVEVFGTALLALAAILLAWTAYAWWRYG